MFMQLTFVLLHARLGKFFFARAYMKFHNQEGMVKFARVFDGHLFKNAKG